MVLHRVGVVFQVGERHKVWKSRMALSVSGSLYSGVWGSPILREFSEIRYLGTTALLFRAKRGLLGPPCTVAAVVPGCAAPGSSGGLGPRLAVNVEVVAGVNVPGS